MSLTRETLAELPLWFIAFLFSLTCHEAAHAWAALRGGDRTAYQAGQVTLNPIPHMQREPFGTILVPLISYLLYGWMLGWASAPYDPYWAARHPRRAAWMAAAGPAANFAIVLAAAVAIHIGIAAGVFSSPSSAGFTSIVVDASGAKNAGTVILSILFSLNLLLGVFNLLPVPPLDGNTAIGLLMNHETYARWRRFFSDPNASWMGLLVAWIAFGYIFNPIFTLALNLLYPGMRYG
jgi:Zn-dependent protease